MTTLRAVIVLAGVLGTLGVRVSSRMVLELSMPTVNPATMQNRIKPYRNAQAKEQHNLRMICLAVYT